VLVFLRKLDEYIGIFPAFLRVQTSIHAEFESHFCFEAFEGGLSEIFVKE